MDADDIKALRSIHIVPSDSVPTINRLKVGPQMLHIRNIKAKRNSSVCQVRYSDNETSYELFFISVRRLCIVNKVWYAIGDVLDKTNEKILDCDDRKSVCSSPY